jgi:hypothetical protein
LNDDSTFAWLESLAARQGADEETLLVAPEDRPEVPDTWVEEHLPLETIHTQDQTTPEEEIEPMLPPEMPQPQDSVEEAIEPVEEQEITLPGWMQDETEPEIPVSPLPVEEEDTLPEGWRKIIRN